MDAQRAVPLPKAAPLTPAPTAPPPPIVDLDAPTQNERPVTHGLPVGPGAGPEVLGLPDRVSAQLRAAYQRFPDEDVRELIEILEQQGR